MVRTSFAALFLLIASTTVAQPLVLGEVRSAPMEKPANPDIAVPAMSIVKTDGGFIAAWSAGLAQSRITIARLDTTLRVIERTQRDVTPVSGAGYDAVFPDLVPTANGYLLACLERPRVAGMRDVPMAVVFSVSPSLDATPRLAVPATDGIVRAFPRDDGGLDVIASSTLYRVTPEGTLFVMSRFEMTAADATFAGGKPVVVSAQLVDNIFASPLPLSKLAMLSVSDTVDTILHADRALQLDVAAGGIGSDGTHLLVSWFIGTKLGGGAVYAARGESNSVRTTMSADFDVPLTIGTFGPRFVTSRPSIASDGERFLVVWRDRASRSKISGAIVTADGKSTALTIAESDAELNAPIAIAAGRGTFVVGYEIESDADHRILARRYVTLNPPHARPGGK